MITFHHINVFSSYWSFLITVLDFHYHNQSLSHWQSFITLMNFHKFSSQWGIFITLMNFHHINEFSLNWSYLLQQNSMTLTIFLKLQHYWILFSFLMNHSQRVNYSIAFIAIELIHRKREKNIYPNKVRHSLFYQYPF